MTDRDGVKVCDREGLMQLVLWHVREFLCATRDGIDLAKFGTQLLEYCNGPRPEITIVPNDAPNGWPDFNVELEPEGE
jgi:hypothetical protein